jgi:hypothetical protein
MARRPAEATLPGLTKAAPGIQGRQIWLIGASERLPTWSVSGRVIGDPALARNVCCVSLRGRRFLSWVHIRLIGNAAAVAAGGGEAKAAETERNR